MSVYEEITAPIIPTAKAEVLNKPKLHNPALPKPKPGPPEPKTYKELYNRLLEKPMSEDDLAKEKKRFESRRRIAALSDGLSAISNLFFTSKGAPNMYNPQSSMSQLNTSRYRDLLEKDRDIRLAYTQGMAQAYQFDWQAEREKRAEAQRAKEREQAQANQDRAFEYQNGRDAISDNQKAIQHRIEVRKLDQKDRELNIKQQDANTRHIKADNPTLFTTKKDVITIVDKDGNTAFNIDKRVWAGSMQQVYKEIIRDLTSNKDNHRSATYYEAVYNTPSKKEDFVKENWYNSAAAIEKMRELSSTDPDNLQERTDNGLNWGDNEDDEILDW